MKKVKNSNESAKSLVFNLDDATLAEFEHSQLYEMILVGFDDYKNLNEIAFTHNDNDVLYHFKKHKPKNKNKKSK